MGSWTEPYLRSFAALKSHNCMILWKTQWITNRSWISQRERGHREPMTRLLTPLLDPVCTFFGKSMCFWLAQTSLFPVNAIGQGGQNPFCFACLWILAPPPSCSSIKSGCLAGSLGSELTGFKCPCSCWDTLLAFDFAAKLGGTGEGLLAEKARFWNWKALLDVGLNLSLMETRYLGLKPPFSRKPKDKVY